MTDNKDKNTMTEKELNALANKIVSRMVKLKAMEEWFHHVSSTEAAWTPYEDLKLTEEEDAIGESAKLMTLLNIFQDKEEYEKCAIVKNRLDVINNILNKY